MSVRVITPPAEEPVSLVEAKAHLREDSDDYNAQIAMLLVAARQHLEDICGVYFAQQTVEVTLDRFPCRLIEVVGPIISLDSVKYDDADGAEQTLDPANYLVDSGRYVLAPVESWPSTIDRLNAVRIQLTVGYDDVALVPAPIKAAILLLLGNWYSNREAVVIGKTVADLPMGVRALVAPYRRWRV